jgi:hypothetical protein
MSTKVVLTYPQSATSFTLALLSRLYGNLSMVTGISNEATLLDCERLNAVHQDMR